MTSYTGVVRDGTLDYNSPYFVSSGAIGAFIATDDGTSIRVYQCSDIQVEGALDWTLVTNGTFTPGAGWNGKCRIISSREEANFLLLAWKDHAGVHVARSTNITPSFGAAGAVGAVVIDTDHDNDELGVAVYDELQVILAPDGSTSTEDGKYKYSPYVATSKTGAFSAVGSIPAAVTRAVLGCVMANSATTFYVAMEKPVPPTITPVETVTFDGSGWTNYSITGAGTTSGLGANPPVAYNAVNLAGVGLSNSVLVSVDFENDYILNGMTWVPAESGGTLTGKSFFTRVDCFDAEGTLIKRIEDTSATQFLSSVTANDLKLEQPVRSIEITLTLSWASDTGSGISNVYIDDIAFTATLVEQALTRKLYQVTTPATWADVTPFEVAVPIKSYGMGFDHASASNLSMLAVDEKGNTRLLNSTTGGSSWVTTRRNVPYTGLKRGGDSLILWGYNTIELSPDRGTTHYRRIGNWVNTIGAVDEIRWVAGVL